MLMIRSIVIVFSCLAAFPLQAEELRPLNILSIGTTDRGWGLSYERFLHHKASLQFQADVDSQQWLDSEGIGASFRFYPVGRRIPDFFGGARVRLFEQHTLGDGASGFYRGLRGGPITGIRLPFYGQWAVSYVLAWNWDLSLYQSDPQNSIGDAWMADVAHAGTSGHFSDALSVGYSF